MWLEYSSRSDRITCGCMFVVSGDYSGQSRQSWTNARIRTPRKTSYQLTFLQSPICLFNFQVANPIEQRIHHFLKPQLSAAREKSLIWRLIDRTLNNPAPADRQPPNSISSINANLLARDSSLAKICRVLVRC